MSLYVLPHRWSPTESGQREWTQGGRVGIKGSWSNNRFWGSLIWARAPMLRGKRVWYDQSLCKVLSTIKHRPTKNYADRIAKHCRCDKKKGYVLDELITIASEVVHAGDLTCCIVSHSSLSPFVSFCVCALQQLKQNWLVEVIGITLSDSMGPGRDFDVPWVLLLSTTELKPPNTSTCWTWLRTGTSNADTATSATRASEISPHLSKIDSSSHEHTVRLKLTQELTIKPSHLG